MSANFNIKKEATKFRELNGLSSKEPIRLKSLLLKLKVLTVFKAINESFSGMTIKSGKHRFMLINSKHSLGRQHFTICHELYHLYVQNDFTSMTCKTASFDRKDKIEYDADWFATYFLMPEEGILSLIADNELKKNKIKLGTIVKIEQYYSCSRTALLYRLENMGLIEMEQYKGYSNNVKDSAKFYGYNNLLYDGGNEGLIIGDYGEIAKDLFDKEIISESHYMSLMRDIGIDIDTEFLK